ncbi:MAG: type IV toxin-antitoxin system AbiEi family antitoxin domain-containing protein [Propionibacteriales bacterium]|nr:type IV toxin-antitoxin system AbiEi family antitoxin domain-containing protein [Propionibacteriales bacterium]
MPTQLPAVLGPDFPLPLDEPFSFDQARRAGLARRQLALLTREGLVRRLLNGVYVAAQAQDDQLLRARALKLVVPPNYVVTDESAGWLAGAPMILRPGSHLEVPAVTIFGADGDGRLRNGLAASGRRHLLPRDITEIHGVRVTTPLRTAADLGRLRHRDQALSAMDQLLGLRSFTLDELLESLERFRGFRGVRQIRWLAPLADPRSESPGESALRLRFYDANLPRPVPQVEIFDGDTFLARVDLAIEELKFVAEYDGLEWHGPDRLEHDRRRRDALQRAGYTVCVFTSTNVYGRKQDAVEVLRAGVRAARARLAE